MEGEDKTGIRKTFEWGGSCDNEIMTLTKNKPQWRIFFLFFILFLNVTLSATPVAGGQNIPGGICIFADGTVTPKDAPVSRDGNLYTLQGKIKQSIFIQKNDIIVNGNGFMTMTPADIPAWESHGLSINGRTNVTVKNLVIRSYWLGININNSSSIKIHNVNLTGNYHAIKLSDSDNSNITSCNLSTNWHDGIQLYSSHHNKISKNRITTPDLAIIIEDSEDNTITQNHIYQSEDGIVIIESSNNHIQYNNFSHNQEGIWIFQSNNTIQHNNFIDNDQQAILFESQCTWSENYWSDHQSTDPYIINEDNQDPNPQENMNIIPEFTLEALVLLLIILPLFLLMTNKMREILVLD